MVAEDQPHGFGYLFGDEADHDFSFPAKAKRLRDAGFIRHQAAASKLAFASCYILSVVSKTTNGKGLDF